MKTTLKFATPILAIMIAAILFLGGCKKDDDNKGMTRMKVRMIDAPSPYNFQEVNIDVVGVETHIDNQWYNLAFNAGIYNILTLVNGTNVLIADDSVPAGHMSQLRLILGDNNTIKVDGVVYPLTIPSGSESGLKLNVHEDLPVDDYTLMIDFDAAHSIVVQGNNEYKLKPVLHAFTVETTGMVSGQVAPALPGTAIIAVNNANPDITYSAYADPVTGQFLLQGLVAGTYTVNVYPPGTNIPIVIVNVAVSDNTTTVLGIITI
jgi:hypothetical protein